MRVAIAFLVSPTLGVWSTYGVFFLWAEPVQLDTLKEYIWSWVTLAVEINVMGILLAIPMYLLIRVYWGWKLWPCVLGGVITALYVSVLYVFSSLVSRIAWGWGYETWLAEYYWKDITSHFILIAIPAAASGFFFWLLIGSRWRQHDTRASNQAMESDA